MLKHARFVARFANFSVGVQTEIKEHYATGQSKVLQKHIEAQFQHGLLDEEATQIGLSRLAFSGLPEDRDTEGLVSARPRLSVFDSAVAQFEQKWTDDETEMVIEALRKPENGLERDYVEIEAQPAELPWANYDAVESAEKIVELAVAIGIDFADVIAYEQENANREDILAALEEAKAVLEADSVVIQA